MLPYQAIGDDVVLAYERSALNMETMASVRNIVDEDGVRILAIDALNFENHWFGLEFDVGANFKSAKINLKTYPARQVNRRYILMVVQWT